VLFQELTLIRWVPSQVRVIAYFPNVVLIAAFLGLGIGCLRVGKASLLRWWPISILVLVVASIGMGKIAFTQESVSDHLWLLYYDIPHAPVIKEVRLPIVLLFIMCCTTFIPLGQFVAERLKVFRDAGASLWGYSFDLLGSLIGVLAFAAASFLRSFPIIWFAVLMLAGLYLLSRTRHFNVAVIFLAFSFHGPSRWSGNQAEFGFFIDHFTFLAGLLFAAVHGPGERLAVRVGMLRSETGI